MAKEKKQVPADRLELYKKLLSTNPAVQLKGDSMPYTSENGNMYSFLNETGSLALRLPKGERESFMEKYNTTLFPAHGTVLKEYVEVPEELFKNTKELA